MCYYFASTKKYYPLEFFSPHFVAGQQHHNSWVAGKPHIIPIPSSFKRSPGTYRDMGKLSPPRFERVFEFFIFGYLWNRKDLHTFKRYETISPSSFGTFRRPYSITMKMLQTTVFITIPQPYLKYRPNFLKVNYVHKYMY